MKKEVYDVTGMHCASCSSAIERVTRKLDGVTFSNVNLPMNTMTIEYDENLLDSSKIIGKIQKAGFDASLQNAEIIKKDVVMKKSYTKLKLIISLVLSFLLMYLTMGNMLFGDNYLPTIIRPMVNSYNFAIVQMLISIIVIYLGKNFYINGFKSLFLGVPNMDSLVALSSSVAFVYSFIVMLFINENPMIFMHNLYFESSSMVVALVGVGKYLEEYNKEKTKSAIKSLMDLTSDTALLVKDEKIKEVATQTIKIGDTILVKSGMKFPLDGTIIKGNGSVDESLLTGESIPVEKEVGSNVVAGSLCASGAIYVNVTKIGEDTTIAKIIAFVKEALEKKAPISKVADKVAGVFVPIIIILSIVVSIIWLIMGKDIGFVLKIFTAILVIACPCAMGLATPMAIIVATGKGATNQILIRSGEALETTHLVNAVIFDKTGTVTKGKAEVSDIKIIDEQMLKLVYQVELLSNHPLSKAIVRYCEDNGVINHNNVKSYLEIPGQGLKAEDNDDQVILIGNDKLMMENNIDLHLIDYISILNEGKTVIFVAFNGCMIGYFGISDPIKENSKEAIAQLKKLNIKTILLTGDKEQTANFIGKEIGVDDIISQVLPNEKADVVKNYQKQGYKVMMVGDGVNDSIALAAADVGVAIGSGSDVAIDSADIVLMRSDLMDVNKAIVLSKMTIANIKQNLFWAFFYNVLSIPIAAGLLYPSYNILLSPMVGAIAMSCSSLFVVGNALRLKGKKL
ncbi:MAG: heavy metal translocating P-type ATPase [Erysipelotrichaceae bacterium]